MQNRTYYNFLTKILEEQKMSVSSVGRSILRSQDFATLLSAGFLEKIPAKTGGGSIVVKKLDQLKKYYTDKFPQESEGLNTAVGNVHLFRNTKAGKRLSQNVALFRGKNEIAINSQKVNLESFTKNFGVFGCTVKSLDADTICIVENLDSFLMAEKVITEGKVFVHTYGGLGRTFLKCLNVKSVLVFPDYDFKGLHNYLVVKDVFPNTNLFLPENYDELHRTKSRSIKTKLGREQQPSQLVKDSVDPIVVKIRSDIYRTKKFLEQQALFND